MFIKITKLTKSDAEIECADCEGFHMSETITASEAKELAMNMIRVAYQLLELEVK